MSLEARNHLTLFRLGISTGTSKAIIMDFDKDALHFLLKDAIYMIDGYELEETPEQSEAEEAPFEFYGENKNKVLLLVNQPVPDLLKTREYDLLLKIMAAVKHTPNEFALVNWASQSITWEQLQQALSPAIVIAFNIPEGILPFTAPLHQIGSETELQFILAEGLTTYLHDKTNEKKRLLWGALKQIFGA